MEKLEMILTRDDVVIATWTPRCFIIGAYIAAVPLELHGERLFEIVEDRRGYSYKAKPEFWGALCDELSEELYAEHMKRYNANLAMIEAAKAGDQEALTTLNKCQSTGWRLPEPPCKLSFWPDLWQWRCCWQCGKSTLVYSRRYHYCSEHCRREGKREIARIWAKAYRPSRAKAREDRTCKICSTVFQSRRDDAQYCSSRCRVRATGAVLPRLLSEELGLAEFVVLVRERIGC